MPGMCRTVAYGLVGTVSTTRKYAKELSGPIAFLVDVRANEHTWALCYVDRENTTTRHGNNIHCWWFRCLTVLPTFLHLPISELLPVETFAKVKSQPLTCRRCDAVRSHL